MNLKKEKEKKKEHVFHNQTAKALQSSNTSVNAFSLSQASIMRFPLCKPSAEMPKGSRQCHHHEAPCYASPTRLWPSCLLVLMMFQPEHFSGSAETKAGVWGGYWNNAGMYLVFSSHFSETVFHYHMIHSSGRYDAQGYLSRRDITESIQVK